MIGRAKSEAWKKSISENRKGCGNPMFGKKRSESTRNKCGETLKAYWESATPEQRERRKEICKNALAARSYLPHTDAERKHMADLFRGDKCHFWKGGVTNEHERIRASSDFINWRKNVYERDNFTCQRCKDDAGGNLYSHHVNNFSQYPEERFDVNNGITLCDKCHNGFHKKYGVQNNTREQLDEFSKEPIYVVH